MFRRSPGSVIQLTKPPDFSCFIDVFGLSEGPASPTLTVPSNPLKPPFQRRLQDMCSRAFTWLQWPLTPCFSCSTACLRKSSGFFALPAVLHVLQQRRSGQFIEMYGDCESASPRAQGGWKETPGVRRPNSRRRPVSEGRMALPTLFETKRKKAPIGAPRRIQYLNVAERVGFRLSCCGCATHPDRNIDAKCMI